MYIYFYFYFLFYSRRDIDICLRLPAVSYCTPSLRRILFGTIVGGGRFASSQAPTRPPVDHITSRARSSAASANNCTAPHGRAGRPVEDCVQMGKAGSWPILSVRNCFLAASPSADELAVPPTRSCFMGERMAAAGLILGACSWLHCNAVCMSLCMHLHFKQVHHPGRLAVAGAIFPLGSKAWTLQALAVYSARSL